MKQENPTNEDGRKVTVTPSQTNAPGWITYQVQMRPEQAELLKAIAAREGATPEALASLWLEEKLAEAQRFLKRD